MKKQHHPLRIFGWSIIVSIAALIVGYFYGGWSAFILVLILGIFEISLSFDNAVVNARILEKMSEKWQKIFLSVGIIIAVFGMRLLFPLIIVSIATGLNPVDAFKLAMEGGEITEPGTYAYIIHEAHPSIAAFGGMFLLMLFLGFILEDRDIKWLRWLEVPLAKIGKLESAEIVIGLLALFAIAGFSTSENIGTTLISGIAGMVTYLVVNTLGNFFENKLEEDEEKSGGVSEFTVLTGKAAFMSFLYLEVIDASFSFDGVIGAFAISTDPIIIALGLGLIGAMFVRSITIYLVRKGTLNDYVYLDHGAHWAIGALAVILIVTIAIPVPELITGLLGVFLILIALVSSIVRNKREARSVESGHSDSAIRSGLESTSSED